MVWKCRHAVNSGMIYIQIFPHGKKYVGQTVNGIKRFESYKRHEGSNPHHTNALKLYGYDTIQVLTFDVPEFLLDSVEISLIAMYDTINREKGYNKMTGGANGRPNQDTIDKMCVIQSDGRHKGENNAMFGRKHKPDTIELYKKQRKGQIGHKHTPESIAKFRRSGEAHHSFGKKRTEESKESKDCLEQVKSTPKKQRKNRVNQ